MGEKIAFAGERRRPQGVWVEALEQRLQLTTLPAGFSEALVAGNLGTVMAMDVLPDGRVLISRQDGALLVVKNGAVLPTPMLQITVDTLDERGLIGVAHDPDFANKPFIYVYHTVPAAGTTAPFNEVSRFTVSGDTVVANSDVDVLRLNPLGTGNHNGGAMHFGTDNLLYISVGENENPANSQSLGTLLGKILRIDVSNVQPGDPVNNVAKIVPSTNPFVGIATGINQVIYALGMRNPYTFAVQPASGTIFINDVGQDAWEEIDSLVAGGNYGWNKSEGFANPNPPAGLGPGTYRDPTLAYAHFGSPADGGNAIIGGAFYNPGAGATNPFPAPFTGKYFYMDLVKNWIRVFDPANPASPASPDTSSGFATGAASISVGMALAPDGGLYTITRSGGGQLFKISYAETATPTVAIIATDPNATEQPQDTGTFTLSRTGATSSSLTVKYTVGGSATNGTDYPNLSGSITIPAGQSWVSLNIAPINDNVAEGAETITLTLSNDAAYTVVAPSTATVTIAQSLGPKLIGSGFGTAGSWNNGGDTFDKALDGNLVTFFDAPTGNGNYVGLDLGTPAAVNTVRYAPRAAWAGRMVGGKIQGSNTSSTSGYVDLYTITQTPPEGVYTTASFANATAYRYVRYLGPTDSYGNIAELEFYGDQATVTKPNAPSSLQVTGTTSSAVSLQWNDNSTNETGFKIDYTTDANFVQNVQTLNVGANSGATATGQVTGLLADTTYYFRVRSTNSAGDSANTTAVSARTQPAPAGKLTGTGFGTPGSWNNGGDTFDKALDGSLATFFDAPTGNGNYVGLDLGAPQTITSVRYAPRAGWAGRMVGGKIQGSNTSSTSGYVDLYTITQTPPEGVYTSINLTNSTAYRYVRYLSPTDSYGNIAELEFYNTQVVPPPSAVNLAMNRPAVASSTESSSFPAANATDGNLSTRWSSAFSDPQWIYVDLGHTTSINRVVLRWDSAYATNFQIQVSKNAKQWTTIKTVTGATGGTQDLTGLSGSGRYVRIYLTQRGTALGYSLDELEVYGP